MRRYQIFSIRKTHVLTTLHSTVFRGEKYRFTTEHLNWIDLPLTSRELETA